jgi:hypothetical protein
VWVVLAAALATTAEGQVPDCERIGSLGISGLRMEQGSFRKRGEEWIWSFGTEPQVITVADHGQSGDAVREGDVLVAIDGVLITTRDGGGRLGAVERAERVRLTVRRDGRERDLSIVAGSQCAPRPPRAPAAPRAVRAPPAPDANSLPPISMSNAPLPPWIGDAYLGFSFQCSQCGMRSVSGEPERYVWDFSGPPEVTAVDDAGPARDQLRRGDLLIAIDGTELTTEEGGRLMGRVEPGDTIVWTVERDGRRTEARVVATWRTPRPAGPAPPGARAPSGVPAPPASPPAAGPSSPLRYTGRLGETLIEARGDRLNVMIDEGTGEIIIRSGDLWVRLRSVEGGGGP